MSEEIKQLVGDFLVEQATPEPTIQEKLDRSNDERDRAIQIADKMLEWENPSDTRKSIKDLSALKKEINERK